MRSTRLCTRQWRGRLIIVIGEDVAGCSSSAGDVGAVGGVFGVTEGSTVIDRCIDTPISESAIVGAAAGAVVGMRPVAEIMFADFIGVCMDQIVNQMAKFRYMFGGRAAALRHPLLIRRWLWCCGPTQSGDVSGDDILPRAQSRSAVKCLRRKGLDALSDS